MKFFVMSKDIGIDLGTSNTLLYMKEKGILLREPSVVSVDVMNKKVLAVGLEAKEMIGRTPKGIITVKPLKNGVIGDFDLAQQMLKKFIEKVIGKGNFISSRIVICHPSGITEVEKRAINETIIQAGARKVMLIEGPVVAAIGAGLPVDEPVGRMIVDIGGGTTEVAVVSLGGIVTSKTLRVAGDALDEKIIKYVRKEFNLIIGERTAEDIKIKIGSAYKDDNEEEKKIIVKGRDLTTGLPKIVTITETGIRNALKDKVALMIDAIKTTLEKTEPELAADIMDNGIVLSGGGALLKNLDKLIFKEIHIEVHIAESPLECVVMGTGKCLGMMNKIGNIK